MYWRACLRDLLFGFRFLFLFLKGSQKETNVIQRTWWVCGDTIRGILKTRDFSEHVGSPF